MLVALFFSLLLVAVLQIVARNLGVLSLSLAWTDEFVSMSVLWITFLGAMIAARQNGHIRVDFMEKILPDSFSKITATLANLCACAVCWVVCVYSVVFVIWEFQDKIPGIGFLPSWILTSIIPLACFVIGLRFVLSIFLERDE